MKKLLLSIAVVMTAMAANAQKTVSLDIPMIQKAAMTTTVNGSTSIALQNNFSQMKKAEAADAVEFIDYGVDWADDPDETAVADCSTVTINYTGETEAYEGTDCKVGTVELGSAEWKVLVAEDMSKVIIPCGQTVTNDYATQYGCEFLMMGIYIDEEAQKMMITEEGAIVYEESAETAGLYECTSGIGWFVYMSGGDYDGYCWSRKFYSTFLLPNGVENGSLGKSGWTEYTNPVFIEDLGDEVNIYNFFGTSNLNIIVEDGEVYIPMLQNVGVTNSNVDQDTYGYFYRLLGCSVTDDGYLHIEEDKEYTMGVFGELDTDADGNPVLNDSEKTILTDPTTDGYMGIFSSFDADGKGYYMGYLHSISFTLNEGVYSCFDTDGIKNVTASAKDNKCYNAMGQQVNMNTKGIVIRNGRKFINK